MNRMPTIAIALLVLGAAHAGTAWAADPDVTMQVIEDQEADNLADSHALELPDAVDQQGTRPAQSQGVDDSAHGLAGDAGGGGSERSEAQGLSQEAREQGQEMRQEHQDLESEASDVRENRRELQDQAQEHRPARAP
ncbi:MAG TPA: hypothetical protein VKA55_03085 [Gammaproteobacteria bacterium]|nr:hypothetical protein [Gammaproteobacteria bacterium]